MGDTSSMAAQGAAASAVGLWVKRSWPHDGGDRSPERPGRCSVRARGLCARAAGATEAVSEPRRRAAPSAPMRSNVACARWPTSAIGPSTRSRLPDGWWATAMPLPTGDWPPVVRNERRVLIVIVDVELQSPAVGDCGDYRIDLFRAA